MDTTTIAHAESLSERMIAAFMEGAEAEMIALRGYGLTAEERENAEREAISLYGGPEIEAA